MLNTAIRERTLSMEEATAHVDVYVEDGATPLLFVSESMPGGEVQFQCDAGNFDVYFPKGSPLMGLPNPFNVSSEEAELAQLDPAANGIYDFEIIDAENVYENLRLRVSPHGILPKIGFAVDSMGALSVQAFVNLTSGGTVDVGFKNRTSEDAKIEIDEGNNITLSTLDLRPNEANQRVISPDDYGICARLTLKPKKIDRGFQSGGTMHADILVEPPPTDEIPPKELLPRALRKGIRALGLGAILGEFPWLGGRR